MHVTCPECVTSPRRRCTHCQTSRKTLLEGGLRGPYHYLTGPAISRGHLCESISPQTTHGEMGLIRRLARRASGREGDLGAQKEHNADWILLASAPNKPHPSNTKKQIIGAEFYIVFVLCLLYVPTMLPFCFLSSTSRQPAVAAVAMGLLGVNCECR